MTILPFPVPCRKRHNIGTETNLDGNYTLQVPQDAQSLMFSFVGYRTQEVAIARPECDQRSVARHVFSVDEWWCVVTASRRKEKVTVPSAR
jgi:hypothetical protein